MERVTVERLPGLPAPKSGLFTDEAIHLGTTLLFGGFRGVVAIMW